MIADLPQILRHLQSLSDIELRHRMLNCGLPDALVTGKSRPRIEKILAQHIELQVKIACTQEPLASLNVYETLFESLPSTLPKYQAYCNKNLLRFKETLKCTAPPPPLPQPTQRVRLGVTLRWRRTKLLIQNWYNQVYCDLRTTQCYLGYLVMLVVTFKLFHMYQDCYLAEHTAMRYSILLAVCFIEGISYSGLCHYLIQPNRLEAAEYVKNEIIQEVRERAQLSEIPEERAVAIHELHDLIVYDRNPLLVSVWDKVLHQMERHERSVQFGMEIRPNGTHVRTIKYVGDLP